MFASQRRSPRTTSAGRTLLRLEALEDRVVPASPKVFNTNDAGAGSLRAAVAAINNNGNPDPANTITFELTDGPTWDINLESELILNANVIITGPDISGVPALTIHGWKAGEGFLLFGSRVFTVGEGQSVNLLKLRLEDGAAPFNDPNGGLIKVLNDGRLIVRNSTLCGGSAWHDGGAIWGGTASRITVTDSEIRNNKAGENGGGIAFSGESLTIQTTGGSILNSLSLYPTTIVYNEAGLDGGGVWVSGTGNSPFPRVTLSKVSVNGNIAGESGGGLFLTWSPTATGVPVDLTDVCVRGNDAVRNFAGGIFVQAKTRMTRGAVVGNSARQPEAGIFDLGRRLMELGTIEVNGNFQAEAQQPAAPTDPIPPTALYIGPDAEALLVDASIDASGDGATYFWNDGRLEISDTEDPRGISSSEFIGNYTQSGTGGFVVDLDNCDGDQFQVSGSAYQVTLAGGLDIVPHWTTPLAYGTVYTIIANGTDQYTSGYFSGKPDGFEFWVGGEKFRINYGVYMGDFNDVVLTVVTPGFVTGSIWWDENGNGIHEATETMTSYGWIALFDLYGNMVACVSTNDGSFSFEVIPGQYVLYASQASFIPSPQDQGGDDEYDSDINGFGYSDPFTLVGNQVVDLDIGMVYFV